MAASSSSASASAAAADAAAAAAAAAPALPRPEPVEEDDELEEFDAEAYEEGPGAADDDELWKDNWEDEEPDDDFIAQLRAEQAKLA
ncbi:hypothetical protein FNF27_03348 [Cafeteria roenbergensis]|uniref:26S proteasome complex subunit DSS1 n=1 Tax=Cafeteria roenbergensis TaxID=33653 RepID=A0A5A8CB20_CAFRO|nr:hypothetical protein FNF29_05692 [Cafeteria roenbergensis]KAA0156990.1 hypothetical protein FNF31_05824 [Cafeteria roenbergensis]KAA0160121.1 hypothetical protein FNF28_05549 [Cafeteria roenbergensis]KAA0175050.1 hypothetical protein FNF27_03348 [Cafeteria roenbergensis]|eukprot:KAA0149867.1 hypothetical protein FNF29_05692 [Cafeteria roenbergensis]